MNIAIISSRTSANTRNLVAACDRRSIGTKVYQLSELTVDTHTFEASSFMQHDAYMFRGYNRSYSQAQGLAQYLTAKGKVVIDRNLASGFVPSKFHEALTYLSHGIPHPRTLLTRNVSSDSLLNLELPVVVKDVDSQRGKGVRLVRSYDELRDEIARNGGSIILQEFVPMLYDIRVICIGDEVIGAIRRDVVEGDFRSNVSLGSSPEVYELDSKVSALALRAHVAMRYDVSGVDIGLGQDGEPFVIETNITPEWQGFKSATGIDVADRIVRHIIERYDHER